MATAIHQESNFLEGFRQNHLCCGICLEVYKAPKLLPCAHTFCLHCIMDYSSAQGRSEKKSFSCPLCRADVTIPEEGVAGFPTNWEISRIVTDIAKYRDMQHKRRGKPRYCGTCTSHPSMDLVLSCVQCAQAVCTDCIVETHNGHKMETLQGPIATKRMHTDTPTGQICSRLLTKALDLQYSISDEITKTHSHQQAIMLQIDQRVEMFQTSLNVIGQRAKEDIDREITRSIKLLKGWQESVDESLEKLHEEAEILKKEYIEGRSYTENEPQSDNDQHMEELRTIGMRLSTMEISFLKQATNEDKTITFSYGNADIQEKMGKIFGRIGRQHDNEANSAAAFHLSIPKTPPPPYQAGSSPFGTSLTGAVYVTPYPGTSDGVVGSRHIQPLSRLAPMRHNLVIKVQQKIPLGLGDMFDLCIMPDKTIIASGKTWFASLKHQIKMLDFHGNLKCKMKKNITFLACCGNEIYGLNPDKKILYIIEGGSELSIKAVEYLSISSPCSIASDSQSNIYICSKKDKIIYKRAKNLDYLVDWAHCPGEPYKLCMGHDGNLAVSHYGSCDTGDSYETHICMFNQLGQILWDFSWPVFIPIIACDVNGNVLVCDRDEGNIFVVNNRGQYCGDLVERSDGMDLPVVMAVTQDNELVIGQDQGDVITVYKIECT